MRHNNQLANHIEHVKNTKVMNHTDGAGFNIGVWGRVDYLGLGPSKGVPFVGLKRWLFI